MMKKLLSPRFRYGTVSGVLLVLGIAVVLLLNVFAASFEEKHALRVDYSFNALTTQSETTKQILAALDKPVHIYALCKKGEEDLPLMELLRRYGAQSDLITWEQVDISLNPGLLEKFRSASAQDVLTNNEVVVWCEATDRFRVLSESDFVTLSYNYNAGVYELGGLRYESALTGAIRYVTQDTVSRVMMLQGHGELDEGGTALFAELLTDNQLDVYYFTLDSKEAQLQPGDLLCILSPQKDLTDREMEEIGAFIRGGGACLFTCDYSDPLSKMTNYAGLLRSYGFAPLEGMVIADSADKGSYYNQNRLYLRPNMQLTELTQPLWSANLTSLVLAGSRAFELPDLTDSALSCAATLTSGDTSYLRRLSKNSTSLEKDENDEEGPFALALESTHFTETGDVTRAAVLGCSTLLTSEELYAMTDSQEYILRTVRYLLGDESSDLGIMAKAAVRPQLRGEAAGVGAFVVVVMPMLVVGLAVVMLWPRRKK